MVSKNWHVGGDYINARFSSFKRGGALLQRRAEEVLGKRGDRRDWTTPFTLKKGQQLPYKNWIKREFGKSSKKRSHHFVSSAELYHHDAPEAERVRIMCPR